MPNRRCAGRVRTMRSVLGRCFAATTATFTAIGGISAVQEYNRTVSSVAGNSIGQSPIPPMQNGFLACFQDKLKL